MTDTQKKIGAVVLAIAAGGFLVRMIFRNVVTEEPASNTWTLMDSETDELVRIPTLDLQPYPMTNPNTGKKTLYATELCYWGPACKKKGGTRVIMNELMGKQGPTKCPACGHVVFFNNPMPQEPTSE